MTTGLSFGSPRSTQNLQKETKKSFDLSAADIDKLQSEFKSFFDKMSADSTESLGAQLRAYESYLDEYERLAKSGAISQENLLKLRESIQKNHEEKIRAITKKETESAQRIANLPLNLDLRLNMNKFKSFQFQNFHVLRECKMEATSVLHFFIKIFFIFN